jgi:hypothetical protein
MKSAPNRRDHRGGVHTLPRLGQPVERCEHLAEGVQQAAAFGAFLGVSLDPCAPARAELFVDVFGHVPARPTVIEHETRAVEQLAHGELDPTFLDIGSQQSLLLSDRW